LILSYPDPSGFESIGLHMKPSILAWCALTAFAAQSATVRIQITDPIGQPMPARIHLKDLEGRVTRVPQTYPSWRDHFVCDGRAELELPAGTYTYEIERGPEFTAASGSFIVSESGATNITVALKRFTNLAREGWWSGELHVHRPPENIQLLMQAEDLHIAHVITWWNESSSWKTRAIPENPLTRFDSSRFLQVMAGEDERGGGALLYLNLPRPLDITGSKREFPSSIKFLREARKDTNAHVDIEKPFWWDTPLWLASGLIDTIGIAHNHMHRGGVLDNEAWGRPRDRAKYVGPQGNGRYTQDIYYHILNCGLRVPPSAGSASGVLPNPVGYNRVYVYFGDELSWEKWHAGLRSGRTFVSNGPLLRCRANNQLPGHTFRAEGPLQVQFDIKLDSRDPTTALELVRNGNVVPVRKDLERTRPITIRESGWFLVRAIANVTNTFRFASTAPWYVEISNQPMVPRRDSAQFFVDWTRQRIEHLNSTNLSVAQRDEVLGPWKEAEGFWRRKLAATAN
jgi:hypothetical protein